MVRNTKVSRNAAATAKKDFLITKKAVLTALCKSIHDVAKKNKHRLPYGFMKEYANAQIKLYPWLTYHSLNCFYQRFKRSLDEVSQSVKKQPCEEIYTSSVHHSMSDLSDTNTEKVTVRSAGRPTGSTMIEKRNRIENIVQMKNDITAEYVKVKNKEGTLKKGQLEEIIKRHKKKRKLEEVDIPSSTIRQRVLRNKTVVLNHHRGGHSSPLESLDDTIVDIVLMMARICQCLTPSSGLALVNSMIDGQPIQQDLIAWKKKYCISDASGTVGKSYWRAFMNRNRHRLVSNRGQKYALDRQNWTTCVNFKNTYDHTLEEMITAGVAVKLEVPTWQDRYGNICPEEEAFGCKVTHKLLYPGMCLVGDEVGGNLNMSGDGHSGGQLFLTGSKQVPYQRVSTTEKRFTMIGLTGLDGTPVMCVLIIQGKKRNLPIETGIDISVQSKGEPTGKSFFF